jgi:hypothetical protein
LATLLMAAGSFALAERDVEHPTVLVVPPVELCSHNG